MLCQYYLVGSSRLGKRKERSRNDDTPPPSQFDEKMSMRSDSSEDDRVMVDSNESESPPLSVKTKSPSKRRRKNAK